MKLFTLVGNCSAEVYNFYGNVFILGLSHYWVQEHNIVQFDVSMHYILGMHVGQRA